MTSGWRSESERHSLARKGISTSQIIKETGYRKIPDYNYGEIAWITSSGTCLGGLEDSENPLEGKGHEFIDKHYEWYKIEVDGINMFVREGNIRVNASIPEFGYPVVALEFSKPLTSSQKRAIKNIITSVFGDFPSRPITVIMEHLPSKQVVGLSGKEIDGLTSDEITILNEIDIIKVFKTMEDLSNRNV